jgi:hypothetical protein
MIETTCHRKKFGSAKLKTIVDFTFPYYTVFVVDPDGIWTSLKMVLTPLNITHYRLFKS